MKFYTYILESEMDAKLYIGQTSNLEKRVRQHNSGGSCYTKSRGQWNLVYSIEFSTRSEAILLERKLKKFKNPLKVKEWIIRQRLAD